MGVEVINNLIEVAWCDSSLRGFDRGTLYLTILFVEGPDSAPLHQEIHTLLFSYYLCTICTICTKITLLVKVSGTPVIRGNVRPLSNPDNKDKQAANRDKHRRH